MFKLSVHNKIFPSFRVNQSVLTWLNFIIAVSLTPSFHLGHNPTFSMCQLNSFLRVSRATSRVKFVWAIWTSKKKHQWLQLCLQRDTLHVCIHFSASVH